MMSRNHRSAYANVWCGVALIRIETGRYERLAAEDEEHAHIARMANRVDLGQTFGTDKIVLYSQ